MKAISQDMKDGASWYVLANAHLSKYFLLSHNLDDLNYALKAYQQAEDNSDYQNPDLFYNRGTILEYMERYQEAIKNY